MKFPVDLLADVSHSELEQSAHNYMNNLLYSNPDCSEHLTLSDSTQVTINIASVGFVPLHGSSDKHKVLALFSPSDPFTAVALYLLNKWWVVDDILRTADPARDGAAQVETVGERIVLYILNRVVYRVKEMSTEELPFLCHGEKDHAKILWNNGEAIGFYSVKPSGTLCNSFSTRSYQLPVMDSIFVRKCQRGKGFGLQMLEDFVLSFKEHYLGLRYPLTKSMYKVCERYLCKYPEDTSLLWEVEGTGALSLRTNIASKIQAMNLNAVSKSLTFTEESLVITKVTEATEDVLMETITTQTKNAESMECTVEIVEEVTALRATKETDLAGTAQGRSSGSKRRKLQERMTEDKSEKVIRVEDIEAENPRKEQVDVPEMVQTEAMVSVVPEEDFKDVTDTTPQEETAKQSDRPDTVLASQDHDETNVTIAMMTEEPQVEEDATQDLNNTSQIIVENVASEIEEAEEECPKEDTAVLSFSEEVSEVHKETETLSNMGEETQTDVTCEKPEEIVTEQESLSTYATSAGDEAGKTGRTVVKDVKTIQNEPPRLRSRKKEEEETISQDEGRVLRRRSIQSTPTRKSKSTRRSQRLHKELEEESDVVQEENDVSTIQAIGLAVTEGEEPEEMTSLKEDVVTLEHLRNVDESVIEESENRKKAEEEEISVIQDKQEVSDDVIDKEFTASSESLIPEAEEQKEIQDDEETEKEAETVSVMEPDKIKVAEGTDTIAAASEKIMPDQFLDEATLPVAEELQTKHIGPEIPNLQKATIILVDITTCPHVSVIEAEEAPVAGECAASEQEQMELTTFEEKRISSCTAEEQTPEPEKMGLEKEGGGTQEDCMEKSTEGAAEAVEKEELEDPDIQQSANVSGKKTNADEAPLIEMRVLRSQTVKAIHQQKEEDDITTIKVVASAEVDEAMNLEEEEKTFETRALRSVTKTVTATPRHKTTRSRKKADDQEAEISEEEPAVITRTPKQSSATPKRKSRRETNQIQEEEQKKADETGEKENPVQEVSIEKEDEERQEKTEVEREEEIKEASASEKEDTIEPEMDVEEGEAVAEEGGDVMEEQSETISKTSVEVLSVERDVEASGEECNEREPVMEVENGELSTAAVTRSLLSGEETSQAPSENRSSNIQKDEKGDGGAASVADDLQQEAKTDVTSAEPATSSTVLTPGQEEETAPAEGQLSEEMMPQLSDLQRVTVVLVDLKNTHHETEVERTATEIEEEHMEDTRHRTEEEIIPQEQVPGSPVGRETTEKGLLEEEGVEYEDAVTVETTEEGRDENTATEDKARSDDDEEPTVSKTRIQRRKKAAQTTSRPKSTRQKIDVEPKEGTSERAEAEPEVQVRVLRRGRKSIPVAQRSTMKRRHKKLQDEEEEEQEGEEESTVEKREVEEQVEEQHMTDQEMGKMLDPKDAFQQMKDIEPQTGSEEADTLTAEAAIQQDAPEEAQTSSMETDVNEHSKAIVEESTDEENTLAEDPKGTDTAQDSVMEKVSISTLEVLETAAGESSQDTPMTAKDEMTKAVAQKDNNAELEAEMEKEDALTELEADATSPAEEIQVEETKADEKEDHKCEKIDETNEEKGAAQEAESQVETEKLEAMEEESLTEDEAVEEQPAVSETCTDGQGVSSVGETQETPTTEEGQVSDEEEVPTVETRVLRSGGKAVRATPKSRTTKRQRAQEEEAAGDSSREDDDVAVEIRVLRKGRRTVVATTRRKSKRGCTQDETEEEGKDATTPSEDMQTDVTKTVLEEAEGEEKQNRVKTKNSAEKNEEEIAAQKDKNPEPEVEMEKVEPVAEDSPTEQEAVEEEKPAVSETSVRQSAEETPTTDEGQVPGEEEMPTVETRALRSGGKAVRATPKSKPTKRQHEQEEEAASSASTEDEVAGIETRVLRKGRRSVAATTRRKSKRARTQGETEEEDKTTPAEEIQVEETKADEKEDDSGEKMEENNEEKGAAHEMENAGPQDETEKVEAMEEEFLAESGAVEEQPAVSETCTDGQEEIPVGESAEETPSTDEQQVPGEEEVPTVETRALRSGEKAVRTTPNSNDDKQDEMLVEKIADSNDPAVETRVLRKGRRSAPISPRQKSKRACTKNQAEEEEEEEVAPAEKSVGGKEESGQELPVEEEEIAGEKSKSMEAGAEKGVEKEKAEREGGGESAGGDTDPVTDAPTEEAAVTEKEDSDTAAVDEAGSDMTKADETKPAEDEETAVTEESTAVDVKSLVTDESMEEEETLTVTRTLRSKTKTLHATRSERSRRQKAQGEVETQLQEKENPEDEETQEVHELTDPSKNEELNAKELAGTEDSSPTGQEADDDNAENQTEERADLKVDRPVEPNGEDSEIQESESPEAEGKEGKTVDSPIEGRCLRERIVEDKPEQIQLSKRRSKRRRPRVDYKENDEEDIGGESEEASEEEKDDEVQSDNNEDDKKAERLADEPKHEETSRKEINVEAAGDTNVLHLVLDTDEEGETASQEHEDDEQNMSDEEVEPIVISKKVLRGRSVPSLIITPQPKSRRHSAKVKQSDESLSDEEESPESAQKRSLRKRKSTAVTPSRKSKRRSRV